MPNTTRFLLLLTICIALVQASCKEKKVEPSLATGKDTLLIYIMAGQSNMAGRGMIEPQDTITDPRILVVDSSGNLSVAREPLHFYSPALSGLDCGMSFATGLLPHIPAGSKICLVPCAIGNTSIQDWLGDTLRVIHFYSNMMSRARIAMQHGVLKGVLWHQGESNAESRERASGYGAYLAALIHKIRTDIQDEHLPFFAATLADFCIRPYKNAVNDDIRLTASGEHDVYVVSTTGLSCKPDSVHFDASGEREMGRRFAAAARIALPR